MPKPSDKNKDTERFKKAIHEETRPWGKFRSYPHSQASNIKIITVNPGEALSLQYHSKRCEFWVILDKGLEVTAGNHVWQPEQNEEVFILRQVPHRVRCLGSKPARFMEIWIGRSDESDIIRLKDVYGRK